MPPWLALSVCAKGVDVDTANADADRASSTTKYVRIMFSASDEHQRARGEISVPHGSRPFA